MTLTRIERINERRISGKKPYKMEKTSVDKFDDLARYKDSFLKNVGVKPFRALLVLFGAMTIGNIKSGERKKFIRAMDEMEKLCKRLGIENDQ